MIFFCLYASLSKQHMTIITTWICRRTFRNVLNFNSVKCIFNFWWWTQNTTLYSTFSIEMASLCIMNKILKSADSCNSTALSILDLIIAFDTVHHIVPFNRVRNELGWVRRALKWFSSYSSEYSESLRTILLHHLPLWHVVSHRALSLGLSCLVAIDIVYSY